MAKNYEVIYRIGGTENFQWRTMLGMYLRGEAETQKVRLETAGYKALVQPFGTASRIGLPETYEAGDPVPGSD